MRDLPAPLPRLPPDNSSHTTAQPPRPPITQPVHKVIPVVPASTPPALHSPTPDTHAHCHLQTAHSTPYPKHHKYTPASHSRSPAAPDSSRTRILPRSSPSASPRLRSASERDSRPHPPSVRAPDKVAPELEPDPRPPQ